MKHSAFFLALAIVFAISPFENAAFAQSKTTWKGGTPGRPNDWNCASNWQGNRVPDGFSDVFVPNVSATTSAVPVISRGDFEVNALFVAADATLSIEATASLRVWETLEGTDPALFKGRLVAPAAPASERPAEPIAAAGPHIAQQ